LQGLWFWIRELPYAVTCKLYNYGKKITQAEKETVEYLENAFEKVVRVKLEREGG